MNNNNNNIDEDSFDTSELQDKIEKERAKYSMFTYKKS